MEIVKPTPLSENGSFERIVNTGTAKHRRRARMKQHSRICNALWQMTLLLVMQLVILLLYATGIIGGIATVVLSVVIACAVGVLAGRLREVCRR